MRVSIVHWSAEIFLAFALQHTTYYFEVKGLQNSKVETGKKITPRVTSATVTVERWSCRCLIHKARDDGKLLEADEDVDRSTNFGRASAYNL